MWCVHSEVVNQFYIRASSAHDRCPVCAGSPAQRSASLDQALFTVYRRQDRELNSQVRRTFQWFELFIYISASLEMANASNF